MSGMPVVPGAKPRAQIVGTESGTARPFVTVNGGGSSGSIHLVGSSASLTEQTRIDFETADDVRTVIVTVDAGQGSHAFGALVVFDPGSDVAAANLLNASAAKFVAAGQSVEFALDTGCTSVYVIGLAGQGSTAGSVAGRIWVEGLSHA